MEWKTVVGALSNPEELQPALPDLKQMLVGFRGDTLCLVGQAQEPTGLAALPWNCLPWQNWQDFSSKSGVPPALTRSAQSWSSAADRTVSSYTVIFFIFLSFFLPFLSFYLFFSDLHMKEDIAEGRNFPSAAALTFSYKKFNGLVARSSATCGPTEIKDYAESPTDIYEWEFSPGGGGRAPQMRVYSVVSWG